MSADIKNKRITITGGKSFLGKQLINNLQKRGCKSLEIADLPEYNLIRLGDIRKMYRETKPDIVIHLAAKVDGIGYNSENPASLFYENAMMGTQLLHEDYAKKLKSLLLSGRYVLVQNLPLFPSMRTRYGTAIPKKQMRSTGLRKR